MRLWCVVLLVFTVTACGDTPPSETPSTPPVSPTPTPTVTPHEIGAVTTTTATPVRSSASRESASTVTLRADITLPVSDRRDGFLRVLTPCEATGWVAQRDVELHERAGGTPGRLRDATIVVDAGHGGQLPGAVGPTGLREADPNADIAQRLIGKLDEARVFLSRTDDITAGLGYRTALANALGAHALVSIHNNADPDGPSERPGTETYYQSASPASKRLAGLLYEEVVGAVGGFEASWAADRDAGAKYRLNASGRDYYALLRGSRVPTVIVESLYVVNPSEEALLRRPEVVEAIAEAVTRGLRRFFETSDPGSGFVEPYPREPGPSGRLPTTCHDPTP